MTSHYKGVITPELVKYDPEKNTLIIKPRALDITWGGDPRYWKLSPGEGAAELLQVSWLQVNGSAKLSTFEKGKDYAVKFRVELKPDNFGWNDRPVYLMVGFEGQRSWKKTDLSLKSPGEVFNIPIDKLLMFRVPEKYNDDKIEFGLYEVWRKRWKGGLVIHEVLIERQPN